VPDTIQHPLPGIDRVAVPEVDECAARRSLLDQVAKLEDELSALFCASFPRKGFEWSVRSRGGPRLLSLGELERVRDALAARLGDLHTAAAAQAARQADAAFAGDES